MPAPAMLQRLVTATALVALAGCPRASVMPAIDLDADATMNVATPLAFGSSRELEHRGRLRPSHGDSVDWVRIDAAPGLAVAFAVTLSAGDDSTITLAAFAADGRLLARPKRDARKRQQEFVIEGLAPVAQLYLRVATVDRGEGLRYRLQVREVARTAAPGGPSPCDPDAFDPTNPLCRDECDFAHPGEDDPRCCAMWKRCLEPGGFCRARVMNPKFPLWLDLGRKRGLFGQPTGHDPDLEPTGYLVSTGQRLPILLVNDEDERSTWRIDAARPNVHDPFIHFTRAEIYPPPFCQRRGSGASDDAR